MKDDIDFAWFADPQNVERLEWQQAADGWITGPHDFPPIRMHATIQQGTEGAGNYWVLRITMFDLGLRERTIDRRLVYASFEDAVRIGEGAIGIAKDNHFRMELLDK